MTQASPSYTLADLMAKKANTVPSETFRVTISSPSMRLLEAVAARGIYGRNPAEVASRFIDTALERFIEVDRVRMPLVVEADGK